MASSVRSARLALYGTISLCTLTTLARSIAERDATHTLATHQSRTPTGAQSLRLRTFMNDHFTCSVRNMRQGRVYTLVTAAFNHGDFWHYAGNMLGLWSFGRGMIARVGVRGFVGLVYGGAGVGNAACLMLDKAVERRGKGKGGGGVVERNYLGASGGVCSLVTAAACYNPYGMMVVAVAFVPVPLPMVAFPFLFAAFSAWAQTSGCEGNVAHLGHLGGLMYGGLWFYSRLRGGRL